MTYYSTRQWSEPIKDATFLSNREGDADNHGQVQEVKASLWEEQSTQATKGPNKKLNSNVIFPYMNCQSTEDVFSKERAGQNVKTLSQHVFQQQLATFLKVNCEVSNVFLSRVKWVLVILQTPAGMGEGARDRSGRVSRLDFAIQIGWRKSTDQGLLDVMAAHNSS